MRFERVKEGLRKTLCGEGFDSHRGAKFFGAQLQAQRTVVSGCLPSEESRLSKPLLVPCWTTRQVPAHGSLAQQIVGLGTTSLVT
jgi:hypothetical protein